MSMTKQTRNQVVGVAAAIIAAVAGAWGVTERSTGGVMESVGVQLEELRGDIKVQHGYNVAINDKLNSVVEQYSKIDILDTRLRLIELDTAVIKARLEAGR